MQIFSPIVKAIECTRYRAKRVACKSSEKNPFQNAFTVCNVALDAVVESIEVYQITKEQKDRIVMVHSHIEYITQSIDELDEKLNEMTELYKNEISLLCTVPGVDRLSAITIISQIGIDMSQFSNSKRLCSWLECQTIMSLLVRRNQFV